MNAQVEHSAIPINILMVDDRPENLVALRSILAAPDYRLVEARSGAEALRRLLQEEFAVLLVDVVMPEMDGFELAAAIKERERTAAIPILFLSGQATDVEPLYHGYQAGAVDYLVKPLVPDMVRAKVAVFAELYRQRKRIEQQAGLLVEAERRESEFRLIEARLASERRYRALAEAVPHIIWTARPDGRVDYFNQRWFEYTGITAEQAAAGSWGQAVHPDDLPPCEQDWQEALRTGETFLTECRLRRGTDGEYRWHLGRAVPERGTSGQIVSWLGTFTDIEDQKRAQAILAEFKGTLDAVLDAVMIFDPASCRLLYANHGAQALLDYEEQELLRMKPYEFMVDQDEGRFQALLAPLHAGTHAITVEARCRRKDAGEIPVEFSFQLVRVNGSHVVSIARDITVRKALEAKLEQEARTDPLTGSANRRWFLELARHELARTRRHGGDMALLMLDVDHFKAVNDRYGHPAGDRVLKTLVEVCRDALREEDTIGRLGGEEFAVLLPQTDGSTALDVGDRVRRNLAAAEVSTEQAVLRFTASIGVASLHATDRGVEDLLGRADRALYAAKEGGRNRVCCAVQPRRRVQPR